MNNTINYSPSELIVPHPYQQQQPKIQIQPIKTLTIMDTQEQCIIVAIQFVTVIPRDNTRTMDASLSFASITLPPQITTLTSSTSNQFNNKNIINSSNSNITNMLMDLWSKH